MATELGQAYVQIMPSAKGISGSIQKVINPEAAAAGKSAGINIAEGISKTMGSVGKTLTKAITLPAVGAAAAIGGIVSALGFKRLAGLDSARAKLQGLGYDAESVERITNLVNESIQGTTTTMAEGVSVAAGALAAGVKEGAELERFIKLVGDAAVGAGRDTGEMAQIFNRVQGAGKLMTQELNMIEQGMPGFAQAMSDSLGVPQDEFRKMVTEGKVSSDQFLDVMESFAGDMSDAYAGSWDGIVSRTKSNIGILGEIMLGGVFEQSKEALANFLEFIRTDEVRGWFEDAGVAIGNVFSNVLEYIQSAMEWWSNLSDTTKGFIKNIGLLAIAIGPLLSIGSKLITGAIKAHEWFGKLKFALRMLEGAIAGISAPVLIAIGAIAGLIAIFVTLYNTNEEFRELVDTAWAAIKETISNVTQAISDFVMNIFGNLVSWWNENNELIKETIQTVWGAIQAIIMGILGVIVPIVTTAWEGIKASTQAVWEVIKAVITTAINLVKGIIKTVMQLITGDWRGAWETIKSTVSNLLGGIKNIISSMLNAALTIIRSRLNNIKSVFSSIFNGLRSIVSGAFGAVGSAIRSGMSSALSAVTGFFSKFKNAGRNIVTSIADGIKGAVGVVTSAMSGVTKKIRDFLPFSPAKEGPLKDLNKLDFGGTISVGIDKGASEVQEAMEDMLQIPPQLKFTGEVKGIDTTGTQLLDSGQIIVPVYLEGREIARVTAPFMNEELDGLRDRKKRGGR